MKFRLTITASIEYEPDPQYYEGATTPAEMLQIDIDGTTDDPFILFEGEPFMVTGEIIKDEITN